MSCSDDRTVRVWDLTEDVAKWTGIGHEDYIRSGCYLPGQEGMIVSGSYDQTVRLWDTRQAGPVLTFKHAAPVESVLAFNNATIASAAGNEVSILNLAAGKVEQIVRSHQKTVTSLCTAQRNTQLLTSALDGHVKVHNATSWEVIAGYKYSAPVLSLAVISASTSSSSEDRHLAAGLENGLLSIRTRLAGVEKTKAREKEKKMQALIAGEADELERKQRKKDLRQGIRARDRGKEFRGEDVDLVIAGNERSKQSSKKLQPWQRDLRKGKYSRALDLVLQPAAGGDKYRVADAVTLLTALKSRSALRTALANRTETQLLPVLEWCLKYVALPRYVGLAHDVLVVIMEVYGHDMAEWNLSEDGGGDGKDVMKLVKRIEKRVRTGVELAQKAESLEGMVECLEAG
jgi:U3 small nucleolar RNA-associated protein 15